MDDIYFGEEDAKYHKKKIRIKKAKKVKHKHIYDKYCAAICGNRKNYYGLVNYCSICGKVRSVKLAWESDYDYPTIQRLIRQGRFVEVDEVFNLNYVPIAKEENDN